MNKITHDGNDYEVLSLDRIIEITHARLAGGKVVEASCDEYQIVRTKSPTGQYAPTLLGSEELEPFGIQPLKLLERKPVEFVGEVYKGVGNPYVLAPMGIEPGMKFRCTQIVEVTK